MNAFLPVPSGPNKVSQYSNRILDKEGQMLRSQNRTAADSTQLHLEYSLLSLPDLLLARKKSP